MFKDDQSDFTGDAEPKKPAGRNGPPPVSLYYFLASGSALIFLLFVFFRTQIPAMVTTLTSPSVQASGDYVFVKTALLALIPLSFIGLLSGVYMLFKDRRGALQENGRESASGGAVSIGIIFVCLAILFISSLGSVIIAMY